MKLPVVGAGPPVPEWRPKVDRAADQACGHCGEGMGFGWVNGLVACYPCYRDAERAGGARLRL